MKFLLFGWALLITNALHAQAAFRTSTFELSIDARGRLTALKDLQSNTDYLYRDTTASFLQLRTVTGTWEQPTSVRYFSSSHKLVLTYPSKVTIEVSASSNERYLSFTITDARPMQLIDRILWGSYPTTISETVGEVVGVVRDNKFAIGIQALNLQTTGGYPFNDEGYDLSRGSAAISKRWGSTLQAYSINRSLKRQIAVRNGDFQNMPVVPLPEVTIQGSAVALFGVPESKALQTIGDIEVKEGLPHPVYNGQWIKQSPERGRSYLISNFTEADMDEMISYTVRAGLMSLYHEGPFSSWGTYDFNPTYFPSGKEGVREAVRKAHAAGIHFGVHTLTNFINTNDRLVTPVPDSRLVETGSSELTESIDALAHTIPIGSPIYFDNEKNNALHTVRLGNELIRYRSVSAVPPYQLLDCQRGAFNTVAGPHAKASKVSKLLDHAYEVVFPSMEMQNEIATHLAQIFNETGIDHLDFDGHEGGVASGQGDYGIEAFSKVFYDHVDHFVVNGTSNSKHFYWHMNTYCNWGEPWYGGFRESMQEYRIANQALFDRNYMPHMMGWYLMTSSTSLSDMEWMLARAAGYDAGFAMVLRVRDAHKNAIREQLLDAIREWEAARRAGAFSSEQKQSLRNTKNEFHLERTGENQWMLYPYHETSGFEHLHRDLQPGEPVFSLWQLDNKDGPQPMQFTLKSIGNGRVINPELTIDLSFTIKLPVTLNAGESLIVDGTTLCRIYDAKGKQRATLDISPVDWGTGKHSIRFSATTDSDEDGFKVVATFKTKGDGEPVKKQ